MLESGDKVGDYKLIKHLGSGVYGEVWLAEMPIQFADKGVLHALKFLSGKAGRGVDIGDFRHEINTWIEASGHPNVVSVFNAFVDSGRFVVVSEYVSGGSLCDWLENNGNKASSIEKAVEIMSGILNGLIHLHSLNITHRDLKPDNILLHHGTPQIADFGMSRIVENSTLSNTMAGSPPYMSPEAFRKSKNPQTDVWSAGVIFHEMLSGQFPFYGEDLFSWMEAVKSDNPKSLPTEVPEELRKIVKKALQKDATLRFKTAKEMREALNKAIFKIQEQKSLAKKLRETIVDISWKSEFEEQPTKPDSKVIYLAGHSKSVNSVTFSPDGKLLASGSEDKTVMIWDLTTNSLKQVLVGHTHEVQCVAFSPDGKILATGSYDETVKLWDVMTGNLKQTLAGNSNI